MNRRYKNDDELVYALEELVKVSDPKALFLNSIKVEQRISFIGREKELKLIDDAYKDKNVVIINGCGGIGKTELAKYYLISRKCQYHTIVFGKCVNGLRALFKDDEIFSISNYDVADENKIKIIGQLVDENTLICIDNLDVLEDPYLDKLMSLPCKILITTRANLNGIISESMSTTVLTLDIMSYEDLEKIFYQYYTKKISLVETEFVSRIIQQIGGLSLMVPILAKQMMLEDYLPSEMYEHFKSNHLKGISNTLVKHFKDNKLINATAYNQALQIFEVFSLREDEKVVLYILALLGNIKISKRTLAAFAGQFKGSFDSKRRTYEEVQSWLSDLNKNADLSVINSLIDKGYLEVEAQTQYVYAHNIIREISLFEFEFTIENCQFFKELMLNVYNQVLYSFMQEDDYSYSIFEYYLDLDFFEILEKITYDTFIQMFIQMIKNMDFTRVENRRFIFKQLQFLPTIAETYFQEIRDKLDKDNIYSILNKDEEMDYLLFVLASEMNDKRFTDFSGRNVLKDRFAEEFEQVLRIYNRDRNGYNMELPYNLLLSLSFSSASEFGYTYNHHTIEVLCKIYEKLQEVYDKCDLYTLDELTNHFMSLYEDIELEKQLKELKESLHPKKTEHFVDVDSKGTKAEKEEVGEVKHIFDPYEVVFDMLTDPFIAEMDKGIQLPFGNIYDKVQHKCAHNHLLHQNKEIQIGSDYPNMEWDIYFCLMMAGNLYFNHSSYFEKYIYEHYARKNTYMFIAEVLTSLKIYSHKEDDVTLTSIFGIYKPHLHIDAFFLEYIKDPYYTLEILRLYCENVVTEKNIEYSKKSTDYLMYDRNNSNVSEFYNTCEYYANEYHDQELLKLVKDGRVQVSKLDISYEDSEMEKKQCLSSKNLWKNVLEIFKKIIDADEKEKVSIKQEILSNESISEFYRQQLLKSCDLELSMFDMMRLIYLNFYFENENCCYIPSEYHGSVKILERMLEIKNDNLDALDHLFVLEEIAFQYLCMGNRDEASKYINQIVNYGKKHQEHNGKFDYLVFNAIGLFLQSIKFTEDSNSIIYKRLCTYLLKDWLMTVLTQLDYYELNSLTFTLHNLFDICKFLNFTNKVQQNEWTSYVNECFNLYLSHFEYLSKIFIPENYLNQNDERFEDAWSEERCKEYYSKCNDLIELWKNEEHSKEDYQAKYIEYLDEVFPFPEDYGKEFSLNDIMERFKKLNEEIFNKTEN